MGKQGVANSSRTWVSDNPRSKASRGASTRDMEGSAGVRGWELRGSMGPPCPPHLHQEILLSLPPSRAASLPRVCHALLQNPVCLHVENGQISVSGWT